MNYVIPPHRRGPIEEVLKALSPAKRVLLTTHVNADGDGTGSEVAMASWLRDRGKEVWIINPTPFPDTFRFLLTEADSCLDPESTKAKEVAQKADLALVLDTGEVGRIGRVMDLIGTLPTIVVDHHPVGPDPIPGVSFRDPDASATGELLFDLFSSTEQGLSRESALGLYVAILTDTGSFRFSNATPRAHRVVARLLEAGVDPEDTHRRVYGNYPHKRFKLLHASLGELEVNSSGSLAWMTVPTRVFNELSATPADLDGLVDYPREIKGVEVGILFRETAKGGTKVSFRSNGAVDVNVLARQFGGGGHKKAAGAKIAGPLEEVRVKVLEATRAAIHRDTRPRGGS